MFLLPLAAPSALATPTKAPSAQGTRRSYITHNLKRRDQQTYKAAGLIAWRHGATGSIDILLGRQVSRHKGSGRYGTWTWLGGKRDPGETCPRGTAAREVHEETLGYLSSHWVAKALKARSSSVLWNPVGDYAIHLAELAPDAGGAVAKEVSQLATGEVLPLCRHTAAIESSSSDADSVSFAAGRAILDERAGGPMLLSQFFATLYEMEPRSREEVKAAGSASRWLESAGILTSDGPKGTQGMEAAWLARSEQLEVDCLTWLPWVLLASRRDYTEAIPWNGGMDETLRVHPYLGRILGSPAGALLKTHFEELAAQRARRAGEHDGRPMPGRRRAAR